MLFVRNRAGEILLDCFFILIGSILYAISIAVFAAPNTIAPGGLTGLSTLLNYLFATPIGTMTALFNIPIILWAIWVIGYKIVVKTIVAILVSSGLIDLFSIWIPSYHGDDMLAAIFAGVLEGFGLSLIFLRGGTTGGTDMTARLLIRKFPHLSMGKIMFFIDFLVIFLSSVVYQSIESGLYALIVIFVSTKVIDAVLYGMDIGTGKMMFIISEHYAEIADVILKTKSRGATLLYAKGAYSQKERPVLFCAVRKYEVPQIRQLVKNIDNNAFLIIGEAGQISGEGFQVKARPDVTLRELLAKRK